jgi:hypothetical protein
MTLLVKIIKSNKKKGSISLGLTSDLQRRNTEVTNRTSKVVKNRSISVQAHVLYTQALQ